MGAFFGYRTILLLLLCHIQAFATDWRPQVKKIAFYTEFVELRNETVHIPLTQRGRNKQSFDPNILDYGMTIPRSMPDHNYIYMVVLLEMPSFNQSRPDDFLVNSTVC